MNCSSHILVVGCFRSSSGDSFGCVMVTNGPVPPMACRKSPFFRVRPFDLDHSDPKKDYSSPSVQLRIQTLFDPSYEHGVSLDELDTFRSR